MSRRIQLNKIDTGLSKIKKKLDNRAPNLYNHQVLTQRFRKIAMSVFLRSNSRADN